MDTRHYQVSRIPNSSYSETYESITASSWMEYGTKLWIEYRRTKEHTLSDVGVEEKESRSLLELSYRLYTVPKGVRRTALYSFRTWRLGRKRSISVGRMMNTVHGMSPSPEPVKESK